MPVRVQYFPLNGGTDLVTSYLQIPPGRVTNSRNYEAKTENGYRRIAGYVLYDGSNAPAALPGEGAVRGVWILDGDAYAIRDHDVADEARLYKATASGWTVQDLGETLEFDTGTASVSEGDVLTGATSGATGTVRRIIHTGGSYSGGDRTGYYTLYGVTGTFVNGELLQVAAANKSSAVGANTANTLPKGGRYEFTNANFFGPGNTERMYACGGVGPAWEYDGSYFSFCRTGVAPADDTPSFIRAHKDHLILGYTAGSLMISSLGEPLEFDALTGAAEIAVGDYITGLHPAAGGVMFVFGEDRTHALYGNNADTWQVQLWSNTGAYPYTMNAIGGNVIYLDALGVQTLQAAQAFGDFAAVTISRLVRDDPTLRDLPETATASVHCRNKDSYRLFFGNKGWFFTMVGPNPVGAMAVDYAHDVHVACNGDRADKTEFMLFGDSNGNVFEMESGSSFDGTAIESYLALPFNHVGSPTMRKRWRKITLDIEAGGVGAELFFLPVFELGDAQTARNRQFQVSTGDGGLWNFDDWNAFDWDSPLSSDAQVKFTGHGATMAAYIYSNGLDLSENIGGDHTIYGVVLHYSPRRLEY